VRAPSGSRTDAHPAGSRRPPYELVLKLGVEGVDRTKVEDPAPGTGSSPVPVLRRRSSHHPAYQSVLVRYGSCASVLSQERSRQDLINCFVSCGLLDDETHEAERKAARMKTAGTAGIQKFARMRSPHREGPGGAPSQTLPSCPPDRSRVAAIITIHTHIIIGKIIMVVVHTIIRPGNACGGTLPCALSASVPRPGLLHVPTIPPSTIFFGRGERVTPEILVRIHLGPVHRPIPAPRDEGRRSGMTWPTRVLSPGVAIPGGWGCCARWARQSNAREGRSIKKGVRQDSH